MSQDNNTQPQEDIKAEEVEVVVDEQTLADIVPDEPEPIKEEPKKGKPESVPIDVYLQLKKELKDLKKNSSTSKSVDSSIEEIASEFDVDPSFAQKLANAIETSSMSKFEERYLAEKREMEYKQKMAESESKLDKAIEQALENEPHFKGIANPEVIKELARKSTDKSITVSQLLENVYGNAVTGKKTMETATPSNDRGDAQVDFTKAGDPAVYAQIKSDPKLWKEYNEFVMKHLNI
jgi:hypothetical protein